MTRTPLFFAVATAALGFGAAMPAHAQDQGTPWSGWYVGATMGGSWGDNSLNGRVSAPSGAPIVIPPADIALINNVSSNNNNKTGFSFGVEGGYNWLASPNWLVGIETEFASLDINENRTHDFTSTGLTVTPPIVGAPVPPLVSYHVSQRAKTNWMWSLRPRVGYVSGPWLVYGTAGIATADIKVNFAFSDNRVPQDVIASDSSSTKTGWIAGLGAGYAFSPNWSVKGEWLYADFGSISTSATTSTGFVTLTTEAKVRANIIRAGIDYRF